MCTAAAEMMAQTPRVVVNDGARTFLVDASRVSAFVADCKLTRFVIGEREYLLRESLDSLERRLARQGFMRVHRSMLLNLTFVQALLREGRNLSLELRDGSRHLVSRRCQARVRSALGLGRGSTDTPVAS